MYNLSSKEEIAAIVGHKSDFELIREFVIWGGKDRKEELQVIALEIERRRGWLSFLIFPFLAVLTNSIVLIVEGTVLSGRWLYFEDTPKDMVRIYLVGIVWIGWLPLLFWLIEYRMGSSLMDSVVFLKVIFGVAFCFGIVKTIFDLVRFARVRHWEGLE